MKFSVITFFALVAVALAAPSPFHQSGGGSGDSGEGGNGPSQITNNNLGNIVDVDIDGRLKLNNEVNVFLLSMIIASLNRQGIIAVAPSDAARAYSQTDVQSIISEYSKKLDPQTLQYFSKYLSH